MSANVLLILLNKFRKRDNNSRLAEHLISFLQLSLINSTPQEYEC